MRDGDEQDDKMSINVTKEHLGGACVTAFGMERHSLL